MNIGIIGAGNMGATLTRRLTVLGHKVAIANSRGPQTLTDLSAETGATPLAITEVTTDADVVIVAIPQSGIRKLPAGILDKISDGAVVVDTGNYVPALRDGNIADLERGTVESRWTEAHLGHPVIKAFNTIHAHQLATRGKPVGAPGRIALPVAGDDAAAKAKVIELVEQLGFDAIDAGGLDESWRQQPGTPVYTADLDATAARAALAEARTEHTTAWRARLTVNPRSGSRSGTEDLPTSG
jgi:8-hydroxy-5-deazaflavin:NADPH oxidoreductase